MSDSTSPSVPCPKCGSSLPANAPANSLCPICLMGMAMRPTQADTHAATAAPRLLSVEEIAPHFPQLEIIECIGRGGMGVVYKARQKSLNRLVALKLVAPEQEKDAFFASRFAREAHALAALNHPSIVTVYDFGEAGDFYYLLMEFVDGVNLRQALKGGRLTPEQALAIVPPVCEALQYAHDHGIVHRDIKPENLLMDKEGRVKIADFGIAKIVGHRLEPMESLRGEGLAGDDGATIAGGTPQYMAPEQFDQPTGSDHRADIYSLGVVLYELLTGELPQGLVQPPSMKVRIDVRLDEIVLRALAQTPELRFQTAADLKTQLQTVMLDRSAAGTSPPAAFTAPAISRERYIDAFAKVLRGLCALLLLLTVVVVPLVFVKRALWESLGVSAMFRLLVPSLLLAIIAGWTYRRRKQAAAMLFRPRVIAEPAWLEILGIISRVTGVFFAVLAVFMTGLVLADSLFRVLLGQSFFRMDAWIPTSAFSLGALLLLRHEWLVTPGIYALGLSGAWPFAATGTTAGRMRVSWAAIAGVCCAAAMIVLMIGQLMGGTRRSMAYAGDLPSKPDLCLSVLQIGTCGLLALAASLAGLAAIRLIRRQPSDRVRGLRLGFAALLTLPAYLLIWLAYGTLAGVWREALHDAWLLPDGTRQTLAEPQAELLTAAVDIGLGLACYAGIRIWRQLAIHWKLRSRPATRRFGLLDLVAAALAIAVVTVGWFFLDRYQELAKKRAHVSAGDVVTGLKQAVQRVLRAENVTFPVEDVELQAVRTVSGFNGWNILFRRPDIYLNSRDAQAARNGSPLAYDDTTSLKVIQTSSEAQIIGTLEGARYRKRIPAGDFLRPVTMCLLPRPSEMEACILNLATGELLRPPSRLLPKLAKPAEPLDLADLKWINQAGADVVLNMPFDGTLRFLRGSATLLPRSDARIEWESVEVNQVPELLERLKRQPETLAGPMNRQMLVFTMANGGRGKMEVRPGRSSVIVRYQLLPE